MGSDLHVFAYLGVVAVLVLCFYIYLKSKHNYWKKHDVPHLSTFPFLGSLKDVMLFRTGVPQLLYDIYFHPKGLDGSIFGMHIFHKPTLMIKEPELIKQILVKDFNTFSNRHADCDHHSDKIGSYGLFMIKNPMWKQIRTKLTPTFTSGRLKQMFSLVQQIGDGLNNLLLNATEKDNTGSKTISMEIKEICAKFTTDVIANIAFGVDANSLKNPDAEFRKYGRKMFDFSIYRSVEFTSIFFLPELVKFFKFKLFCDEGSKFLRNAIIDIMYQREKSGIPRNDLIESLISFKKTDKDKKPNDRIETDEVVFAGDVLVAQAASFFIAGFETTSAAISFCLYELATHQDIQAKLRLEIQEVLKKNNGILTYDNINDMVYLDMIVYETLRLYPALPFLDRVCEPTNKKYRYSLAPFHDFTIPHGMSVIIPIFAIHRDPKHFQNPDEFKPERFLNKNDIKPYTYFPFGFGPRICIGERLALIKTKVGLISFLRNHYVRPNAKTLKTMVFEKKALMLQAEGGIYLDIVKDVL